MAIDPSKLVGVGTSANDNTGDPLRTAFIQINDNFTELYVEPSISLVGNTLTLTRPDDSTSTVDLSPYLDEDARAISSGTLNAGIVTFTRDDASTFTLDLSGLLDDTNAVESVNGQIGVVVLDSDDIAEGSTNEYYTEAKVSANTSVVANTAKVTNANHTGDVEGSTTLTIQPLAVTTSKIADDAVNYSKLGVEFTTSEVISASDVDFSSAQVFTKTLTGTTALTYSSASIGMVKDLVINADGNSFTLPTGTKIIAGTPTTGINFIQVVVTASGEYWTSISQQQ